MGTLNPEAHFISLVIMMVGIGIALALSMTIDVRNPVELVFFFLVGVFALLIAPGIYLLFKGWNDGKHG